MGQVFGIVLLGVDAFDQCCTVVHLDDFHPAILAALQWVGIVGNRSRGACALKVHAFLGDPLLGENAGHRTGAALRQRLVGRRTAGGIGMADHQNRGGAFLARLAGEGAGELAHLALAIGAQGRAAQREHAFVLHLGNDACFFWRGANFNGRGLQGFNLHGQVLFPGQLFKAL